MALPLTPPIEPMLAKLTHEMPATEGLLYEPKWDGFRALIFRDGDEVYIQSREKKPLARYFPEVVTAVQAGFPDRVVVDGELVIANPAGLDFSTLQLRLHPAASRIRMLSEQSPASFIAFDLLAEGDDDLTGQPFHLRRARLESAFASAAPPIYLTPITHDIELARDWFRRFEGAGLDGVMAKHRDQAYEPKKRAMLKIKHRRTADCVVAGFRWHKHGDQELIGSLLLGLHDQAGTLHHVGITSSFKMDHRRALVEELAPLRENALDGHPWASWARAPPHPGLRPACWHLARSGPGRTALTRAHEEQSRRPGMTSRWSRGKDLSWEPLRIERVAEVAYDHLQDGRFRHAATFERWRPDRTPPTCTYAQLEVTPPYELARIFSAAQTAPPAAE